ncbi:carbohydrate ABC transporter permease [Actinoplanes sp. GCM10030250]|uniref:carbohydrate ABC transporter permease n=1 Tax=Actinoplanes sp. GCM10030250 TaxID=3273376 RepID=UPI00360C0EFD
MDITLARQALKPPAVPPPIENPSAKIRRRTTWQGASFTVPYFLGFALFIVVPVIVGLSESLYTKKSSGLGFGGQTITFSGLDNFTRGMSDEAFWGGLLRVTLFSLIVIPVIQIIGLAAALLIDEVGRRAAGRFRVALLIPHMVPGIVAILIWIYLYSPVVGPLTPFFQLFGIDADFYSGGLIWVSIGNIMVWSGIGFNILVVYGALQNIPREIFDSARVDGASALRIAWSIKVPFVRTSLVLTSVLAIIGTLQIFSDPMLFRSMTPETVDRNFTPIMMIYDQAFAVGDLSYASALSIILAAVVGLASAIFYKLTNRTPT